MHNNLSSSLNACPLLLIVLRASEDLSLMVRTSVSSAFVVLLVVFISAGKATPQLNCTEMEFVELKSGDIQLEAEEHSFANLTFRLNTTKCSHNFDHKYLVKVSTDANQFEVDVCKFVLAQKACNMTKSSSQCSCLSQDEGVATFFEQVTWLGNKTFTLTWTDYNTQEVKGQRKFTITSLSKGTEINKIWTLLMTSTGSCFVFIVIINTFVCMMRKRCRNRGFRVSRNHTFVLGEEIHMYSLFDTGSKKDETQNSNHLSRDNQESAGSSGTTQRDDQTYSDSTDDDDYYIHPV